MPRSPAKHCKLILLNPETMLEQASKGDAARFGQPVSESVALTLQHIERRCDPYARQTASDASSKAWARRLASGLEWGHELVGAGTEYQVDIKIAPSLRRAGLGSTRHRDRPAPKVHQTLPNGNMTPERSSRRPSHRQWRTPLRLSSGSEEGDPDCEDEVGRS
jgi:hypothetical protein